MPALFDQLSQNTPICGCYMNHSLIFFTAWQLRTDPFSVCCDLSILRNMLALFCTFPWSSHAFHSSFCPSLTLTGCSLEHGEGGPRWLLCCVFCQLRPSANNYTRLTPQSQDLHVQLCPCLHTRSILCSPWLIAVFCWSPGSALSSALPPTPRLALISSTPMISYLLCSALFFSLFVFLSSLNLLFAPLFMAHFPCFHHSFNNSVFI